MARSRGGVRLGLRRLDLRGSAAFDQVNQRPTGDAGDTNEDLGARLKLVRLEAPQSLGANLDLPSEFALVLLTKPLTRFAQAVAPCRRLRHDASIMHAPSPGSTGKS